MKILIVDDHAIVRGGLRRLLATLPDATVLEAASGRDALLRYREERPDLTLLDLNLPGLGGLELVKRLLLADERARILVFSMHAEPLYAARALQAGALGYVSKGASPDELLVAVRRVLDGARYVENEIAQELALQSSPGRSALGDLSERELEILRLLGEGHSLADIADTLGVAYKTVANTCGHIKSKLGVARTADLIRLSIETGIS
ncbi:MAG TPA: response regulator transcription factor [Aliidongia sp.]|uniref:response regulator transcription factor n=1 Tax=Aliidongia sp. TaxID=1914230 RepID=UPI002DDCF2C6|nr:response regulator transcription factor [Aliidongia sp.]HEV2677422.1 response regulator transcription factor [Aliidongia sp.]